MQSTPDPVRILAEGLYPGVPEDAYHGDPVPVGSLSQSLARYLLPPYTPKHFAYRRANPRPASKAQELGTAAHVRTLGSGPVVEVYDDPDVTDWTGRAAQAWRKRVRAEDHVPLLTHEAEAVEAMEKELRADPDAGWLLDNAAGLAESSFFWIDGETGIWRRGRTDFIRGIEVVGGEVRLIDGQVIIVDYKTVGKQADVRQFARSAWDFYYFIQHPWYVDGIQHVLDLDVPPLFMWVVQETEAPYVVNTFYLNARDETWGRRCARAALRRFAWCEENDDWPGHATGAQEIELPTYARYTLRDWETEGVFKDPRVADAQYPGTMAVGYDDDDLYKNGW